MTPRSLVRYPGGLSSMPQGMGEVWEKYSARPLMWMASAQSVQSAKARYVKHSDYPSTIERALGLQLARPTKLSQSNLLTLLVRERIVALLFSCNHTWWLGSQPRWHAVHKLGHSCHFSWHPPRDAKNCDVRCAEIWCVTVVAVHFRRCKQQLYK